MKNPNYIKAKPGEFAMYEKTYAGFTTCWRLPILFWDSKVANGMSAMVWDAGKLSPASSFPYFKDIERCNVADPHTCHSILHDHGACVQGLDKAFKEYEQTMVHTQFTPAEMGALRALIAPTKPMNDVGGNMTDYNDFPSLQKRYLELTEDYGELVRLKHEVDSKLAEAKEEMQRLEEVSKASAAEAKIRLEEAQRYHAESQLDNKRYTAEKEYNTAMRLELASYKKNYMSLLASVENIKKVLNNLPSSLEE